MPITPENSKSKTLHLHGKAFENLESEQKPGDVRADMRAQQKFEGESFYGSLSGLGKMLKAEKETIKFNRLTAEDRINPQINHERMKPDA